MEATDVVEVIELLEQAGVRVWLHGGWGIDALLGEQTREHDDIDVNVALDDVPRMRALLASRGFSLVHGGPPTNFVLGDDRGRRVDVHPVRFDQHGNGIYQMDDGEDWVFPASSFRGTGSVGGQQLRCLTPEVQVLCDATGYEPDEDDLRDMDALRRRFGVELPQKLRGWQGG